MARALPPQLETEPAIESDSSSNSWSTPATRPGIVLPSLPESHRTIPFSSGASWIRKMLAFAGPGYLVAVGYMDPGNWATDIGGGSKFGYTLLSVILISNLMAMFLQALSAKLGIATGRDLAQACREQYSRRTGLRPCRGPGLGSRPETSFWLAAAGRRSHHRIRRSHRLGTSGARLSPCRSFRRHAHRLDCRLFRLRDLFRSSSLARGRHRLHPPCRNPPQPRNALHRHRHTWRHGHAAQSLPSLQYRADACLRFLHARPARSGALRHIRFHARPRLCAFYQCRDPRSWRRCFPHPRPSQRRRNRGRLQTSYPRPRSEPRQHALRLCAACFLPELHAHRHAGRPDRHGRLSRHSPQALASQAHHPVHRHHSCGPGHWFCRREQSHLVAHSQSGDSQFSVALRGDSPYPVHQQPRQDGRIRKFAPDNCGRLDRRRCHPLLQRRTRLAHLPFLVGAPHVTTIAGFAFVVLSVVREFSLPPCPPTRTANSRRAKFFSSRSSPLFALRSVTAFSRGTNHGSYLRKSRNSRILSRPRNPL